MASKLKHFVRLDAKNQPVLSSNIARRKKPVTGKWARIFPPNCCNDELTYTPLDVTSATGLDFVLKCDTDTIMSVRLIGVVTNLATFVALLNTKLGSFISFEASGSDIVATVDLDIFSPTCEGQLSFTAEAV